VVPGLAAALVIGVAVQALGSASSLAIGEWVATSAGVLVGSCIAYLSALPSHVVFDAARDEVRWQHRGWPGQLRGSCLLADMKGVRVDADTSRAERLVLVTSAGVVPLTRHFSGIEPHAANAAAVKEWLELHGRAAQL
jgi:hypothetical protein